MILVGSYDGNRIYYQYLHLVFYDPYSLLEINNFLIYLYNINAGITMVSLLNVDCLVSEIIGTFTKLKFLIFCFMAFLILKFS